MEIHIVQCFNVDVTKQLPLLFTICSIKESTEISLDVQVCRTFNALVCKMLNDWKVSMTRSYHKHTLQTKPRHREAFHLDICTFRKIVFCDGNFYFKKMEIHIVQCFNVDVTKQLPLLFTICILKESTEISLDVQVCRTFNALVCKMLNVWKVSMTRSYHKHTLNNNSHKTSTRQLK